MEQGNITAEYYKKNAKSYCDNTVKVDLSEVYKIFSRYLKGGDRILDAGCGSGRDIIAFRNMGYHVEAFDISPEIAPIATENSGVNVLISTFHEYQTSKPFAAVWCCASLVHIPLDELVGAIANLSKALIHNGIWYMSFKYGDRQQVRNGRHFTDLNETGLLSLINDAGGLKPERTWITDDARPERNNKWLNAILRKL